MSWDSGIELAAQAGMVRIRISEGDETATAYLDGESFALVVTNLKRAAEHAGFAWPSMEEEL